MIKDILNANENITAGLPISWKLFCRNALIKTEIYILIN